MLFLITNWLAAQNPAGDASSIADILDRGGVGVAALAIVALVVVFWLYVRRTNEVVGLVKETTKFLGQVTAGLSALATSLEARDDKAKAVKEAREEVRREFTGGN